MQNKYLCEVQFGTRGMGYGIKVEKHKVYEAETPEKAWNAFVAGLNFDGVIKSQEFEDDYEPYVIPWSEVEQVSKDGYLYGWGDDDMVIEMRALGPVEIGGPIGFEIHGTETRRITKEE
jgi:hypothetical protein